MHNAYTTKTSSLKATNADIRILKSKTSDSEKIYLRGDDIEDLWGFNDPRDFKKLVKRCVLTNDDNYILWTDTGNIAYISFADKLINGNSMFQSIPTIKYFNFELPLLKVGSNMFQYCTGLTLFDSKLDSLIDGTSMFYNCCRLKKFNNDLNLLENGTTMFSGTKLETFESKMPHLKKR